MGKYRFRRFLLSTVIICFPQFFMNYYNGLFTSGITQWIILLIIYIDTNDRFWITKYFDPKHGS